jgi:hypothetical protein
MLFTLQQYNDCIAHRFVNNCGDNFRIFRSHKNTDRKVDTSFISYTPPI